MNTRITIAQDSAEVPVFYLADEHEHAEGASTALGFWIYLMSDCLIFAVLFAIFGVLGGNYAAGQKPHSVTGSAALLRRCGPRVKLVPEHQ